MCLAPFQGLRVQSELNKTCPEVEVHKVPRARRERLRAPERKGKDTGAET